MKKTPLLNINIVRATLAPLLTAALLTACSADDRSGEVPEAPTVRTGTPRVEGPVATLEGEVLAAPNSRVTARGFAYGNDTLDLEVESADESDLFHATTEALEPGDYYAVAYAKNGMGTSQGDTVRFRVEAH